MEHENNNTNHADSSYILVMVPNTITSVIRKYKFKLINKSKIAELIN